MNWKLIFSLSMFGLFMAFATVFFISSHIEPIFWLLIFLICAYLVAKNAPEKYFLHGFLTSLVNCVWITAVHVLLFTQYAANHVQEIEGSAQFPILAGHPHKQMVIIGPIIGIISGLVLGLFCFIASKIVKKPTPSA